MPVGVDNSATLTLAFTVWQVPGKFDFRAMTGIKYACAVLALARGWGGLDTMARGAAQDRQKAYTEAISLYTLGLLPEAAEARMAIAKAQPTRMRGFSRPTKEMNHPNKTRSCSCPCFGWFCVPKGVVGIGRDAMDFGRYESAKASLDRFDEGGLEGVATNARGPMDFGGVEYSLEAMATPVDTMRCPSRATCREKRTCIMDRGFVRQPNGVYP